MCLPHGLMDPRVKPGGDALRDAGPRAIAKPGKMPLIADNLP